ASEKYTFDDKYGRKWLAQAWDIGFADSKLLIYSMPVPSGFISMAILGEIGDIDGAYRIDLEEYLNYIFFSYYGTFKEWKEYLAIDNYLSAFFKNTHFSYKSNSSVSFKNEQFSVDYNTDLYDISDISSLTLKASYVMGNNGPVWRSVGGLFTENYNSDNFFFFSRETIPEEKLTKNYKDDWDDMKNRNYPFDGSVQPEDGKTYVDELHYSYWDIQDSELDKDGLLYFIGICNEGSKDKLIMEPIMEKAQSALTILE
ncbi:MAG: hypothetical protein KAR21_03995, partial [Spirochaetales bacterium]|nr:hypothetical protein [Spirochaetales bacterium]